LRRVSDRLHEALGERALVFDGEWAKRRAEAAWLARGASGPLTQADLDAAVTFTGTMPEVDGALRERFRDVLAEQLVIAAVLNGGLPSCAFPRIVSVAPSGVWPSGGLSNSATSSPSKAVGITSGCHVTARDRKARCTTFWDKSIGLRSSVMGPDKEQCDAG
jgi:hypothetical protein